MAKTSQVAAHYGDGALLDRIKDGLARQGIHPPLDLDVLGAFDEFHIGGREATEAFADSLRISAASRVLDLGCGLGGPARYFARATGARVTGIDLTADFIEAGRELTGMALMLDLVDLVQGDILELPFPEARFDVAYMIHVGMNVADKAALFSQVARVLKPGGQFGLYDVMALSEDPVRFPVPWASRADHSALAAPQAYRDALRASGFDIESETDRSAFAEEFFARMAARQAAPDGPPPLGLHLVMGADTKAKIANTVAAISAGGIAPIEIIARRSP